MIIFLLLCALAVLPGMKIAAPGKFHNDYISKNQTAAINGFFTLLVFLSHVSTYIKLEGIADTSYTSFKGYMLQAVVIPFLFYSGYGMMESIKKRGRDYVKQIPINRFLKILLHFDIAVVLYLAVNLIFGKHYSLKQILLALTAYGSVDNSNWYIFAVLGLYLIVFAGFMLSGKNHYIGVILCTLFSVGFVLAQILLKRDSWCYDTIILFPVGMTFSLMKPLIEKIVFRHDIIYLSAVILCTAAYTLFYRYRSGGIVFYSMWGILFMALLVLFTMKVKTGNKILEFFGSHVFSIYILQRLPMIVLNKSGLAVNHKYIFVILCFVITVALAIVFDKAMAKIDKKLFG